MGAPLHRNQGIRLEREARPEHADRKRRLELLNCRPGDGTASIPGPSNGSQEFVQ